MSQVFLATSHIPQLRVRGPLANADTHSHLNWEAGARWRHRFPVPGLAGSTVSAWLPGVLSPLVEVTSRILESCMFSSGIKVSHTNVSEVELSPHKTDGTTSAWLWG